MNGSPRDDAKDTHLGQTYGVAPDLITAEVQDSLVLSRPPTREELDAIMERWFEHYPGMRQWQAVTDLQAEIDGLNDAWKAGHDG